MLESASYDGSVNNRCRIHDMLELPKGGMYSIANQAEVQVPLLASCSVIKNCSKSLTTAVQSKDTVSVLGQPAAAALPCACKQFQEYTMYNK